MKTVNILLSGVGGQGVILASRILSEASLIQELDVKQSEVHGMSQRGGSVVSHVRIGEKVRSPLVPHGQCDILLGFEALETLRFAHLVREGGTIIYNLDQTNPSTVSAGLAKYPADIPSQLAEFPCNTYPMPAGDMAESIGNRRSANVILVGALSARLDLKDESWVKALEKSVSPKILEINRKGFLMGKEYAQAHSSPSGK